jgi:hypothetical protein
MKLRRIVIGFMGIGLIYLACQQLSSQEYSDKAEQERLVRIARDILKLKIDRIVRIGSEANFLGAKSENILFSQRLDSRTYLVHNKLYGKGKKAGVFEGSDIELIKISRDILRRLEIPLSEIGEENVFKENTQVAQVDSATGEVKFEKPQKGQRFAQFTRIIEDLPVFSSSALLALTKDGEIGFMELHWPKIPKYVMTEAHRLKYKVEHGWQPSKQKGAIVELIEAGIVHSAALGFLMDIYPAIRVIYAPEDKRMGRKLTLYLNRDGKAIPNPREFDIPLIEYEKRRKK